MIDVPRGVIAVIRTDSQADAAVLVSALLESGVDAIEVTLTVPGATRLIAEVADASVPVGAGTVMDARNAEKCVEAGARFLVAPTTDTEVSTLARQAEIPMIAGALTPNEIRFASSRSDAVKLFPITAVGGVAYIKAVAEVFPKLRFVASGGIEPRQIQAFRNVGCHAVCLGNALIDRRALAKRRTADLAAYAKEQLALTR